ncbi:glycosyl hydrolase lipoprotein [Ammoniphilus oxalaticus]|uniref:glycosyl hydrolase lipoprotein n=1 Tax=Ammoniphilus oxalaticus TaxID=66863 RepID=UPI0011C36B51|nr:glycosyl hydrolase lipoprotein [Ammoniphilus oxalaticus]
MNLVKETEQQDILERPILQTEQFIFNHLLDEAGMIRTDFKGNPNGNLILSESMGLWLEYLALKKDNSLFDSAYLALKKDFISKENLVMWKVEGSVRADTNALIDDLRIIASLFRKGEQMNRSDYIKQAIRLSKSIMKYNRQDDYFVDFYDVRYKYQNKELTLSYLIPKAFQYMVNYGVITVDELDQLRDFLRNMPTDNGFYPKYYSVEDNRFHFDQEINLIDQLYTVIHLEGFGISTDSFFKWIKDIYLQENVIYGRYDRLSKQRIVEYEAPAVYALLVIYSLEKNERAFAKSVYERMTELRSDDPMSTYKGGYVFSNSTHSFDNLLALVAERKLLNE